MKGYEGWDAYAPYYDWENAQTVGRRDIAFWQRMAARADGPILELGCGWGSLTLWMAERYPASQIVAVSNSATQRVYIEGQAARRGLSLGYEALAWGRHVNRWRQAWEIVKAADHPAQVAIHHRMPVRRQAAHRDILRA